jgi:hypothetical protein
MTYPEKMRLICELSEVVYRLQDKMRLYSLNMTKALEKAVDARYPRKTEMERFHLFCNHLDRYRPTNRYEKFVIARLGLPTPRTDGG